MAAPGEDRIAAQDRFEVLLELPRHWSQEQAEILAERMLRETPSSVGVTMQTNDGGTQDELRTVDDAA
jgi:hypothetical protein